MANELLASGLTPGATYYVVVRSGANYANGTTLEAYNAANWTSYAQSAAAANSSGGWVGTMPAVAAGLYLVELRLRIGATPAVTDTTVGTLEEDWTGSGNLRKLDQLWRRFFRRCVYDGTNLKMYADDGTTVLTTQALSKSGTTQTQGPAA